MPSLVVVLLTIYQLQLVKLHVIQEPVFASGRTTVCLKHQRVKHQRGQGFLM